LLRAEAGCAGWVDEQGRRCFLSAPTCIILITGDTPAEEQAAQPVPVNGPVLPHGDMDLGHEDCAECEAARAKEGA
jgi:hypothetical protein